MRGGVGMPQNKQQMIKNKCHSNDNQASEIGIIEIILAKGMREILLALMSDGFSDLFLLTTSSLYALSKSLPFLLQRSL